MKPNINHITINDNLSKIRSFIKDIIISPRHALTQWATITNQTPAIKIGYIGQHLASLVTGIPGTGSGARGDDLVDGSEVKSCNKVDQVDKCKECGSRVLRIENKCSFCGSSNIKRRDDSKWLFSVRDEHELNQYLTMNRIVLLLMDYPRFDIGDYRDIRITVFELYPSEDRMKVFNELITNHYRNIYLPKITETGKANPMNLHPWSFQFYKCNPIKIFECVINNIDTQPVINIDDCNYISPKQERDRTLKPIPMPSSLLRASEWIELLNKADFNTEIVPLFDGMYLEEKRLYGLSKESFTKLNIDDKIRVLPFLDIKLRDYISLRPIKSIRQREHYQRG